MVKDRGLELTLVGKNEKELTAKPYQAVSNDLEAKHGVKTGVDDDMDQAISIIDSDAKKIITTYFQEILDKGLKIAFRIKPVVDSKTGVKLHNTYYFGQPMRDRILNIRNRQHKPVSGNALRDLMKKIRWMDTLELMLDDFDKLYSAAPPSEQPNIYRNAEVLNDSLGRIG